MANAITYIKNVGKSLGYASIDVLKEKNPVFADFAETNGELATEMYKSVKDLKKTIKGLPNKVMESEVGKFAVTYKNNLLEDLKSGKFYNKERQDRYESEAADSMLEGLDMDVFDDFGEGSSGDGFDLGDLEDDGVPSSNEMMDIVGEKTSAAVSMAVARSSEYIVEAHTQAAKASYKQMNAIYGGLHTGMSTINQNITKVLQFANENLNLHIENSRTFYTEITRMDQERNQYLKEISETLKQSLNPEKASSSNKKITYSDLVSSEGVLDISRYGEYLKKSIKDNSGGVFESIEMLMDVGGLQQLAAAPLEGIAKGMINYVIPKALDKSMEALNKSLSGLVGNALMGLKEKGMNSENEIWRLMSDIFGIDTELKTSIDPSQYEKGRVPFDGVTRKAIIEVIPTYLSKILSTLNGQERDTFDYESGRFVTVESLKKKRDDITKNNAISAASEIDKVVKEKAKTIKFKDKNEEEEFWKDWENAKQRMYEDQKRFETRSRKVSATDYDIIHDKNFDLLRQFLDNTPENLGYSNRLYRQIADQRRTFENLQNSSSMSAIYNDSDNSNNALKITNLSSAFGNIKDAIIDKLNEIHKEIAFIRLYGISGSGKNNSRKKKYKPDLSNFIIPTTITNADTSRESQTSSSNSTETSSSSSSDSEAAPLSDKEVNKEEKKEEKNKRKTLSERMKDLRQGALGIVQGPLNLAASVIDRVDTRLYELVYGPVGGRLDREDDDRTLKEILFDNLQNQFDKFADWMEEKVFDPLKYKSLKENAHDAAKKFLGIFGIDLDKSIEGIKSFIFGEDEDGNRTKGGFLGKFVNDFKEGFKSFGNWIKDGFSDTAEWTGTKAVKNVTGQAKDVANAIAGAINKENDKKNNKENTTTDEKSVNVFEVIKDNVAKAQEKASGTKRVTKTGLAVISEGEMIIPPDMNPFNIAKRSRAEKQVKENIKNKIDNIIQFDGGTTSANFDNEPSKEEKSNQRILKFLSEQIKGKNSEEIAKIMEDLKQKYPKTYPLFEKFIKENQGTYSRDDYEKGKEHIGYKIGDQILNATTVVATPIMESIQENFTISDEDKEKFKKNAFDFIGDIKEHGGTLAAGATIGAGVSLLTGLVGGPLLGAAVGAGTALITKSKTVQNMLFGNEEEGKQGLLPKDLTKAIKKYAPDMAKGGAMGGILSLIPGIPGGPIAGMIVGSAIGYAKNSEKAQEMLFGEGKLLGKKEDFQKKVQSLLPKMGAGALAGLIAGPFGSIGANIFLGSALGFATDTNKFKDLMFGEVGEDGKRVGGLFEEIAKPMGKFFKDLTEEFRDFIKTDILQPVKDAVDPLKKQFELMGKGLMNLIGGLIKNHIAVPLEKGLQKFVISPLGKALGTIFKPIKGAFKAVVSSPFKLIGGIGDAARRHQIKSGNADYMSAEERVAYRESKGWRMKVGDPRGDIYHKLDKSMIGKDIDALDAAETALSGIALNQRDIKDIKQDAFKNISKSLRPKAIDYDTSRTVKKMIENGRYEDAIDFVNRANIQDPKVKKNLLDTIKRESAKIQTSFDMKKDSKGTINALANTLKNNLGLELDDETIRRLSKNPKEAEKLVKYIQSQKKYKETHETSENENVEEQKTDEYREKVTSAVDRITELLEKLVGKESIDEEGNTVKKDGQNDINSDRNRDRLQSYQDTYDHITNMPLVDEDEGKDLSVFERLKRRYQDKGLSSKNLGLKDQIKRRYRNKGLVGGTLGLAKDIALTPGKIGWDIGTSVLGVGVDAAKSIGNEAIGLYDAARDSKIGTKILGDRFKDFHKPDEYKTRPYHESKILNWISSIAAITAAKEGINPDDVEKPAKSNSLLAKIKNNFKKGKTTTEVMDGVPTDFIIHSDGTKEIDPKSANNRKAMDEIKEKKNVQKGILAGLTSIPNTLGDLFTNVFGNKDEEKETIFEKILNFFTGNSKSGITLASVLKSSIPLALAAFGLSGALDGVAKTVSDGAFGSGEDTDSVSSMSLSERLKYNTARGTVTGKGSILGKVVKSNKLTKLVTNSKVVKGVAGGLDNIMKSATDIAALNDVTDSIMDAATKWSSGIRKIFKNNVKLSRFADKIDDLATALSETAVKYLPKAGKVLSSIKNTFSKLVFPLLVVTSVADFTTGWQDASTILKIKAENVTLPQKVICGLIRTVKNFIPIIGTFIPEQVITDLFIKYVAGWFGIDVSKITKQRSEAEAELDNYNAENGTNYTWAEYNKKVLGEYTWTESVGNWVSNIFKPKETKTTSTVKKTSNYLSGNTSVNTSTSHGVVNVAKGSGLFGRGSDEQDHIVEKPQDFISQVDPRYKYKKFNIPGDTKVQTLGDSGCAPAAAAMAINGTVGRSTESMENASRLALKYKVKDDGVSASYFDDEFSRHGLSANYMESPSKISNELMHNRSVVLMGQDSSNTSKANSPFGPNPHYITATGMSMDGKYVYINDPEASRPNIKYSASKVLGHSKLGVSAVARGSKIAAKFKKYVARGSYGPETTQYKVWNALRAAGYNEISTAAAMGNIQHESGFRADAIEKGSGVGFGLVQWSYGRRTAMENYAKQKGVNPSNLEVQIEYLLKELAPKSGIWTKASSKYGLGSMNRNDWANGTDLVKATQAFMCCFERPSYDPNVNHIDRRIHAANEFLQAFTGMSVDTNLSFDTTPMTSGVTETATSTSSSNSPLSGLFSIINKFAGLYGLNDSSSTETTTSTVESTNVYSGDASGNVSSNASKAEKQKALVNAMYSIQGKLKYAQNNAKYPGSRNPEDGSGDCSSTVQWAYKKILGVDPGGWTGDQRTNSNTYTVATSTKDESKLQLGDLLLKDGHVEMYAGNNTMIGHGGGKDGKKPGPTVKALDKSGKYNLVRRWVGFQGSGSGLSDGAYGSALNYITARGSNSILPFEVEQNKPSTLEYNNTVANVKDSKPITTKTSTSTTTSVKSNTSGSNEMLGYVKSVVDLLKDIVSNTDQLNNIVKLLGEFVTASAEASSNGTKENKEKAVFAKQNLIHAMQNSGSFSGEPDAELMRLIKSSEYIARQ